MTDGRRRTVTARRQERPNRDTTDEMLERATRRDDADEPADSYEHAAQDEEHPDPLQEQELDEALHDDLSTVRDMGGTVMGGAVLQPEDIAEPEIGPDGEPRLTEE